MQVQLILANAFNAATITSSIILALAAQSLSIILNASARAISMIHQPPHVKNAHKLRLAPFVWASVLIIHSPDQHASTAIL